MSKFFPFLFVFFWSTGFIGAKYGLPHSEPLTFLALRYALVIALLMLMALMTKAPWPTNAKHWLHLAVAGSLTHGIYLGGVFTGISKGFPAGLASLIVGLQPLLVAFAAGWLLKESVTAKQWLGLVLGLVGTALVLSGRLNLGLTLAGIEPVVFALFGITAGTLYQKKYCPTFDWRTGAVAQFIPALLGTLLVAAFTETFKVEFVPQFVFALSWLVLVLSVGTMSLLNYLIRNGSSVNVASLFYLVPASTVAIAWVLFNEQLSLVAMFGMLVAILGVYLARR